MTYRRDFLVLKLWITNVIDLRVKVGDDLFRAHRVNQVPQVGNHIVVLTFRRHLGHGGCKRCLEQPVEIEGQILKHLWQLVRILLLTGHLSGLGLGSTQVLQLKHELSLD